MRFLLKKFTSANKTNFYFISSNIISFLIFLTVGLILLNFKVPSPLVLVFIGISNLIAGFIIFKKFTKNELKFIKNLNAYTSKLASGNLGASFENSEKFVCSNELYDIKKSLNSFSNDFSDIVLNVEKVNSNISKGNFNVRIEENNKKGAFYHLTCHINDLIDSFIWIIDTITIPILIVDDKLNITYVNKQCVNVCHNSKNNLLNKSFYTHFDIDDIEHCPVKNCFETGKGCSLKAKLYVDNECLEVTYTSMPIKDENGVLTSVLIYIIDYTAIYNKNLKDIYFQKRNENIMNSVPNYERTYVNF